LCRIYTTIQCLLATIVDKIAEKIKGKIANDSYASHVSNCRVGLRAEANAELRAQSFAQIFLDILSLLVYIGHTQKELFMNMMQFTSYRFYFSWGYWWRQSAIGGLHSDRKCSRVS
jgi:hypothetical protein